MNPTYAEINLNHLIYNYNSIKRKTNCKIMAVVKADAYGHGTVECAKALKELKNKPEYYGVALESEAIELRESIIADEPILCFGPFKMENLDLYLNKEIMPSINHSSQITKISRLKLSKTLKLHVNVNTGMNRIGLNFLDAFKQIKRLSELSYVKIEGIYTHYATSDESNKDYANLQLNRFTELVKDLGKNNIEYGLAHTANSGAILDMPKSYFDMVRPGISLYGYYPSLETSESIKLKPVMSVYSNLSTVQSLKKGDTVGYGRIYRLSENGHVGSIPIGYADGFTRALSNKVKIIIGNRIFDQIGRVSMDRINILLKDNLPKIGSKATILGSSRNHKIDAWDWSKVLNTIPYEITCNISRRVPRIYIK